MTLLVILFTIKMFPWASNLMVKRITRSVIVFSKTVYSTYTTRGHRQSKNLSTSKKVLKQIYNAPHRKFRLLALLTRNTFREVNEVKNGGFQAKNSHKIQVNSASNSADVDVILFSTASANIFRFFFHFSFLKIQ